MSTASTESDLPLPGAAPVVAYSRFWRRAFVFSGRASPSEYWWAALVNVLAALLLGILTGALLAIGRALNDQGVAIAALPIGLGAVAGFALIAYFVAQIVPGIAVAVRRLHDADLSGFFFLLTLIPSVGGLILLILHVLPSNPAGRRFDRATLAQVPWPVPPTAVAAPVVTTTGGMRSVPANGGFDAWPAPVTYERDPADPATSPLPVAPVDTMDVPDAGPDDGVLRAWQSVGQVRRMAPRLHSQPSWRRQGYLFVQRPDGLEVVSTTGLGADEGATALGPGAEVYLPGRAFGAPGHASLPNATKVSTVTDDDITADWRFTIVAAVARRIGASGMHLPAELDQYGALSMSVSAATAPDGWRSADGGVGVLIGVPLPGAPDSVATTAGELPLIGLAPLRPAELQRIVAGGRQARAEVAAALGALPLDSLLDPQRPAV